MIAIRDPRSAIRDPRSTLRLRKGELVPGGLTLNEARADSFRLLGDRAGGPLVACTAHVNQTPIQSYRDLEAWQLGMKLVEEVYTLTRLLPREELYGLSAQLRRAAVGIPSNVAEGQQHGFGKNYVRYVAVALGCGAEVQTQLELVARLKLVDEKRVLPVLDLASRTGQVLRGLKRSVARREGRESDQI